MCCTRLAGNTGRKHDAKKSPSRHHRTISLGCIFATKAYINNRKKLLSSNTSSTRPRNMVNFGPLTAEIGSGVWGTPANFNGFRILAPLLHGTLVVGVSQTAAFNRGHHLYSAGRPSGWALAHILVPSIMICSILPVHITCLAIFLHNLSPCPLVCLLIWSPPPHIPYISSPNHCLLFTTHAHTIATCLWSPYVIGQTIIFLPCDFYLSIFFFIPHLISAIADWMSTILLHMAWP